jgi:hypothetical protein
MAVRLSALLCRPPFTLRKIPGNHFCLELSRPQDNSATGRNRLIENSSDLIGNRTRDLPACGIVLQPTTLSRAPLFKIYIYKHIYIYVCIYDGIVRSRTKATELVS